jgi:pyruvate-ferredoxin/flavodoxin oxidoreductase
MGGDDAQTVRAFLEADAYDGPSLIVAYSHCINHGYDMLYGLDQQKVAVQTGYWPLLRYNPALAAQGKNPLLLDSKAPSLPLAQYTKSETRYTMLAHSDPAAAKRLGALAQQDVADRWRMYAYMAAMTGTGGNGGSGEDKP